VEASGCVRREGWGKSWAVSDGAGCTSATTSQRSALRLHSDRRGSAHQSLAIPPSDRPRRCSHAGRRLPCCRASHLLALRWSLFQHLCAPSVSRAHTDTDTDSCALYCSPEGKVTTPGFAAFAVSQSASLLAAAQERIQTSTTTQEGPMRFGNVYVPRQGDKVLVYCL